MNLAFPIRLLASAFIFLLSHLKITLPMHSPTNTGHNITSKDKFGTGTPHLADMPTTVHRQNSWKITVWSYGAVSMAMHCLRYNKLTPDGSLANHVFDAAVAVAVLDYVFSIFHFYEVVNCKLQSLWIGSGYINLCTFRHTIKVTGHHGDGAKVVSLWINYFWLYTPITGNVDIPRFVRSLYYGRAVTRVW